MRILFLSFLVSLICIELPAQSIVDAIDYGTFLRGGTARTVGIGGGIGALGGDFSVSSTNPAGLAVFRSSEVVFSPGFSFTSASAQLLSGNNNAALDENKSNFNFNNLGLVINKKGQNWKTSNWALGLNRLANFNQEWTYEGLSQGSITDWFVEIATDANGISINPAFLNPYGAGLAFDAEAIYDGSINPMDDDYIWATDFEFAPEADVFRSERFSRKGSINEFILAWAGNYKNRLMLGISVGVPILNDTKERVYEERDPVDGPEGDIPFFNNLAYTETLETSGTGLNLKLGMIYRVNQMFRLGAAVHTPTRYSLSDEYINSLSYTFTVNDEIIGNVADPGQSRIFEYNVSTPWRVLGSAAAIIRKLGFISAEVEWLSYSGTSFNLTKNSQDIAADEAFQEQLNGQIDDDYSSVLNFRLGGEYAYKQWRFRAGYSLLGNPLVDGDQSNQAYSLGLGFRAQSFYIDFAFRGSGLDQAYSPYPLIDASAEQMVSTSINQNQLFLTVGFKF